MKYVTSLRGYLYCLSELQELRIPCSEETLSYALQHDINSYNSNSSSTNSTTSINNNDHNHNNSHSNYDQIISLVNTWIHDEGHHSDVCELGRDILLISSCYDPQIWIKIISHILNRNFMRLLYHSLVIIHNLPIFSMILSDEYLTKLLSESIYRSNYDIIEKLEQVCSSYFLFLFYFIYFIYLSLTSINFIIDV